MNTNRCWAPMVILALLLSGCAADPEGAPQSNASTPPEAITRTGHLWVVWDPSTAGCRGEVEDMFACVLGATQYPSMAAAYPSGRALQFAGSAVLSHPCSVVESSASATTAGDSATFQCIENQTGFELHDNDVVLYYPTHTGCNDGRNHWYVPVESHGTRVSIEAAVSFSGTSCSCQTPFGFHEVYEASAQPSAGDCCNGQSWTGCRATPGAWGWYTMRGCASGAFQVQAISPAAHEFNDAYCTEMHVDTNSVCAQSRAVREAGVCQNGNLVRCALSLTTVDCGGLGCSESPTPHCNGAAAPHSVSTDVTGDGHADLVTVRSGVAYVYPGEGSGAFGGDVSSLTGIDTALFGAPGYDIVGVADVNGDGHADLVAVGPDHSSYTFLGSATGRFGAGVSAFHGTLVPATSATGGWELAGVADVGGDGRADLVTVRSGSVEVFPGLATGGFTDGVLSFAGTFNSAYFDGEGHYIVGIADVTGDGRADLVTAHTDGTAYVFPGDANNGFGAAVPSFAGTLALAIFTAHGHEPIGVADVDGDGHADLVTLHTDGTAYVYPGESSGRFGDGVSSFAGTMHTSLFGGAGHEAALVVDVTGDGRADLVSAHSDGTVYVYPGRADHTFGGSITSFAGTFDSIRGDGVGHEIAAEGRALRRHGCATTGCR